jgi:hypothetical protein
MNKKKSVIFYISSNKQFFGEFHENTKMKMIKAYLKDIAHINNFQLSLNGEIFKDDEIALKDFISHKKNEIVFRVTPDNNSSLNELAEEYLKENTMLRNEINRLNENLLQINEKNSIKKIIS